MPKTLIKLSQVFRGLSRVPKWVPDGSDVLRLFDAVPDRYHGLLWLGAGAGLRISEALGLSTGRGAWTRSMGSCTLSSSCGTHRRSTRAASTSVRLRVARLARSTSTRWSPPR